MRQCTPSPWLASASLTPCLLVASPPPPACAAEYGCLVDQRFLARISEGEVRVFMIHDRPVGVLHKKPAEGSVSATLFSGAK